MQDGIRAIVGLGNPGENYAKTRHNAGAWFVDFLASQHNVTLKLDKKLRGYIGELPHSASNPPCFLFKPTTYMNESGRAVLALSQFYKLTPASLLVAHDELDFEAGIVRLKKMGGHGGHNGLRDIIACMNSADFYRLRVGVGHPGHRDQVTDYVLNAPNREEHQKIMSALENAAPIISDLCVNDGPSESFDTKIQKAFHALHSD